MITNRVVLSIPITNHNENFTVGLRERNRYNLPIVDNKGTKSTRSSLEISGREVKETPYLILHLKLIRPIPFRRNWTIRTKNSILPRVTPHLNTRPTTNISKIKPPNGFILPISYFLSYTTSTHFKITYRNQRTN